MSDFEPTKEQSLIVEAVRSTSENMLVKALAGAAKTSTLVLIAKATSSIPTLALSFNVIIAKEMKDRLPGNCESKTLNSVGHGAWGKLLGRRLVVNKDKVYDLTSAYISALADAKLKSELYETMAETMRWVRQGKSSGYIPDSFTSYAKRLLDDDAFFAELPVEPTDDQIDLVRTVSLKSLSLGFQGEIDYDDQILLPTVFPASFTQYPQVLLDEAQDMSELNFEMLRKIAKKRLIAVGDECQAIYGFRGAHANSMSMLQDKFAMTPYVLSISFRCPQSVVAEARWRAPHMQWPSWAKPGTVRHLPSWSASDLPEEAAIICRNNAPLFATAIRLLKNGRYPELIGNDLGKALIKILKSFGFGGLPQAEVLSAIQVWKEEKLEKSREKGKIIDQAECLKVFAEAGTNLADAIAYAENIFRQSGPIKLMTGHKSKGLEFNDVFILDRHLVDEKNKESQDRNLLYVMQTRAKNSLTYIDSERFVDNV